MHEHKYRELATGTLRLYPMLTLSFQHVQKIQTVLSTIT